MTEPSFIIRHFSSREDVYRSHVKWYKINLVIEAIDDELRGVLKKKSSKWKDIEYCENIEIGEKYFDGLELHHVPLENSKMTRAVFTNSHGLERSDVFKNGYQYDYSLFIEYLPKFDVFVYRDYVENNGITRATIKQIKKLADGENDSRFANWGQFVRCLETLFLWWD